MASSGADRTNCADVAVETSKVRRSRLLTPIKRAPIPNARASSSCVCTSTSASIPNSSSVIRRSRSNVSSLSAATISSKASAPAAADSYTWNSSKIKSLRRIANEVASRVARKSSSEPANESSSVSTEIAAALDALSRKHCTFAQVTGDAADVKRRRRIYQYQKARSFGALAGKHRPDNRRVPFGIAAAQVVEGRDLKTEVFRLYLKGVNSA